MKKNYVNLLLLFGVAASCHSNTTDTTQEAGTGGYVSEINHQPGDYVQEGEQLAVISDMNSFVFILNLPYELRPFVLNKGTVELYLPDGKTLTAAISSTMPVVDSASQTQNI